jgi:hypothetical protein
MWGEAQKKIIEEVLEDCRGACEEAQRYGQRDYFEEALQRNSADGKELHILESLAPEQLKVLRSGEMPGYSQPYEVIGSILRIAKNPQRETPTQ